MMQRIKEFLKRPSTIAFLAFTALYAVCMGGIFWGTWSLDAAPVEPDNAIFYPIDDAARWFKELVAGHDFVPSDLMHVLGGMYFWQELQYALAGYLAALGLTFYLRGRRVSYVAATCGGAAYGLMGYTFTLFSAGHLGWFIWLMYGPFAFGLVDRVVRKGKWRNWALLGAVLGWAASRQSDMWLLFTVLTFFYGVWAFFRKMFVQGWSLKKFLLILAGVAVTAVCACAIGIPQFTRALTQDLAGREAQIAQTSGKSADEKVEKSAEERWRFCTNWSLPPEDTAEFVLAEIHGGSNDPRVSPSNPYRGRLGQQIVVPPGADGQRHPTTGEVLKAGETIWMPYRQHSLYFGLVTVFFAILALVGWFRFRKDDSAGVWRDVPFWFVAALITYLCALGAFTPFYKLVYALPFGSTLRAPVKFVHLLEFCVAALAGFGFEAALRGFRKGKTTPLPGRILIVVLAAANVINLAYVDSKYCAKEDVSFVRLPNAAAEDVLAAGGGKVFVYLPYIPSQKEQREASNNQQARMQLEARMRQGALKQQEVRNSMGTHLVETTEDPQDPEARFFLVDGAVYKGNARFFQEMKIAGYYDISKTKGVVRTETTQSRFVLLEKTGVQVVPKDEPAPDRTRQALVLLSVLSTFGLIAWGIFGALFHKRVPSANSQQLIAND